MVKNCQSSKKSPKWLKVLKLGSKGFQGVSDGSRSQTAWARTTRGTYAGAPYAFAALGQGPKGPKLVIIYKNIQFRNYKGFFATSVSELLENIKGGKWTCRKM